MPSHTHKVINYSSGNETTGTATNMHVIQTKWNGKYEGVMVRVGDVGNNSYHNNIQPSYAAYRFRRTA